MGCVLVIGLVPACLLIQPLEDAEEAPGGGAGSSSVGTGGTSGKGGSSGQSCGFELGDSCLEACANSTCCSQVQACAANAECGALYQCFNACPQGDDTCNSACTSAHPTGFAPLQTMLNCLLGCGCSTGGAGSAGAGGVPGTTCEASANPDAGRVTGCVYSFGCDTLAPVSTMSDCVNVAPDVDCVNTAQSCADVNNCKRRKVESATRCAGNTGWICDGDTAINCAGNPPYSIACGNLGGTCDLFDAPIAGDTRWPCALSTPPGVVCTDASGEARCNGNSLYSCVDNKYYGVDCTVWNQVCVENEAGQAYCSPRTTTCENTGTVTCVNNAIQVCDVDNRLGVYDCSISGGTCTLQGSTTGYCLAPGCTIAQANNCRESCLETGEMQICVGGAPYVIDCTDYGFDTCGEYINHPVTGRNYVKCRMLDATTPLPP